MRTTYARCYLRRGRRRRRRYVDDDYFCCNKLSLQIESEMALMAVVHMRARA